MRKINSKRSETLLKRQEQILLQVLFNEIEGTFVGFSDEIFISTAQAMTCTVDGDKLIGDVMAR